MKYCPDCGESMPRSYDQNYKVIYHCSACDVYWDATLTRKAKKWKNGIPCWGLKT